MSLMPPEEQLLFEKLAKKLEGYNSINKTHKEYAEGKNKFKNIGVSIPNNFDNANTIVSWGKTAIDTYNSRIKLTGFDCPDNLKTDVENIAVGNRLFNRFNEGFRDAMVYGVGYAVTGYGLTELGEPVTKTTFHSPFEVYGEHNSVTGRLDAAVQVKYDENQRLQAGALYLPNKTIYFTTVSATLVVALEDEHNLGRVPVAKLSLRPTTENRSGQSVISRPMRELLDEAARTQVAIMVMREFFAMPQKFISGANKADFVNQDGQVIKNVMSLYTNLLHVLSPNEKGLSPTVGQFASNSPDGLIKLFDLLKEEFSAMTGLPISYIGKSTSNPPSADALRAMESQLVKTVEGMISSLEAGVVDTIQINLAMRNGGVMPEGAELIRPKFRDAGTPQFSAMADAVSKLEKSNVFIDNDEKRNLLGLN